MKLRKVCCALVCASLLAATAAMGAGAEELDTAAVSSDSNAGISPQAADVIEYRYRYEPYTKKLQYRRWNVTQGRWVDSVWIYVV